MKILFLIDNLSSGGAQRQLVTLTRLLKKSGHSVSVLVYNSGDFFEDQLIEMGIPVIKCFASNYLIRIIQIRKKIWRGKYDAVISFLDVPNFINNISAVGRRKRWAVITSERSSKEAVLLSRRGKLFAWFQRFSDAIVCNSHNAEVMWINHYPQYRKKIHTIYNTVILPARSTTYQPHRGGKIHIVVAASYQYLKNPIGLIRSIARLDSSALRRLQVDWYGNTYVNAVDKDAAYKEACELVESLNLKEIVFLHKPTREIHLKMLEADFVGLFSQVEGLPNTICEAMMLGKPIIMSRVSDYKVLVNEENGFLCTWDDEETIKEALEKAIALPNEELEKMGMSSYIKALKLFSSSVIISQWEDLIIQSRKHAKDKKQ